MRQKNASGSEPNQIIDEKKAIIISANDGSGKKPQKIVSNSSRHGMQFKLGERQHNQLNFVQENPQKTENNTPDANAYTAEFSQQVSQLQHTANFFQGRFISLEAAVHRAVPRKMAVPQAGDHQKQQQQRPLQPRFEPQPHPSPFGRKRFSGGVSLEPRSGAKRPQRRVVSDKENRGAREGKENKDKRKGRFQKNFHENFFSRVELIKRGQEECEGGRQSDPFGNREVDNFTFSRFDVRLFEGQFRA